MNLKFSKYHGTGNDFILIDDRQETFPQQADVISKLCHRHYGIGADGLILIQHHSELDYRMIYFNSDGSQSLCGNGSRCGFQFAHDLGMINDKAAFETTDGNHEAYLKEGIIHFSLFDADTIKRLGEDWYLNTGSPHYIQFVDEVKGVDVKGKGAKIRYDDSFSGQNGTNVNFAQLLPDRVKIRTYERGVEDETLSCGTGATAVGLVASQFDYKSPVHIETEGGDLWISFDKDEKGFSNVWLAGPVVKVFDGTVSI